MERVYKIIYKYFMFLVVDHINFELPPQNAKILALNPRIKLHLDVKRMSATSIMTPKCLHTSNVIYERCLYHSGSALVPIFHGQVRLPPQNIQYKYMKPINRGMLGCQKNESHFNCDFQVFAHTAWVIYKIFASFGMCLGTNTP